MAEKSIKERLADAVKLSDKESKFLLLMTIDPTLTANKAAKLCGYAGKSGTQVKNRVAGKIGGILEGYNLGLETIAENIKICIGARKKKAVFLQQYNEEGKQIGTGMEIVDLGPDCQSIDRATKLLMMLQRFGEQEEAAAPQIPEHTTPRQMSEDDLQKAVGRGGPVEVIEADFEVTEDSDAATG